MRTLFAALASVFLLLVGSCTSPLATLRTGQSVLPPVGPGETQLVFHLNSSAKVVDFYTTYTVNEIKYLVVQLHAKDGQGSKFATATVTGTTVAVNIPGLVAGPWEILVSTYDWDGVTGTTSPWGGSKDNTQPTLLYTAVNQLAIQPGTSSSVSLLLYKPGDLGEVSLTEAKLVSTVTLADPGSQTSSTAKAGGAPIQLAATILDANAVLASEQRVEWTSDNPDVATVNPTGMVFPKKMGVANITVSSLESHRTGVLKAATYTLTVVPEIVGIWRNIPTAGPSTTFIKVYMDSGTVRWEMVSNAQNGAYYMVSSPLNSSNTKSRGTATNNGSGWTLNALDVLEIGAVSFTNKWLPASPPASAPLGVDGSGHLNIGSPVNIAFAAVTNYVPVTSVAMVTPPTVYVTTNTLVAQLNLGVGAQPTIPAVFWQSNAIAYAKFNGASVTQTWNPVAGVNGLIHVANNVLFASGAVTITLASLDFDPVYRPANTAPPGGYPLAGTYVPAISGSAAPTLASVTIGASGTAATSGYPISFWIMPTPLEATVATPSAWTSSTPTVMTVGGGTAWTPYGTWVGPGTTTISVVVPGATSNNTVSITIP